MEHIFEVAVALCVLGISGLIAWVSRIQRKTHEIELKVSENYMHKDTGKKIFEILEDIQSTIHDMDTRIKVMVATQGISHGSE